MNLRRCPCGKVPDGFDVLRTYRCHFTDKALIVDFVPNCCFSGVIKIAVPLRSKNEQIHQAAAQVWNDMPGEGE